MHCSGIAFLFSTDCRAVDDPKARTGDTTGVVADDPKANVRVEGNDGEGAKPKEKVLGGKTADAEVVVGVATAVRNVEIELELAVTDGEIPVATLKFDNGRASFVGFF